MTVIDPAAPQYNATLVRRVDSGDQIEKELYWPKGRVSP
jgi:hypothetical protein